MTEVAALKKVLAKERAACEKQEARVSKVQQELQDAVKKYESLECDSKTQGSELAKACQSAQDARAEAQSALQEIQAAKKIATGKAFIMQSKSAKETFLLLTRISSSSGALMDLPHSISDTAEFYQAKEGSSTEKLFWSQYLGPEHPVPFSDQLK